MNFHFLRHTSMKRATRLIMFPKTSKTMSVCPICTETFSKVKRMPVPCPGCNFAVCAECVRKSILTAEVEAVTCMECRKVFDRPFLARYLPASFMRREYRDYRKRVLLSKYSASLPGAMQVAKARKVMAEYAEEGPVLVSKIQLLQTQLAALKRKALEVERLAQTGSLKFGTETKLGRKRRVRFQDQEDAREERKRLFLAPVEARCRCPQKDCRGFIGEDWRCGLCEAEICPDCFCFIGNFHRCDEDIVKAAKLIQDTSKACPGCKARIEKIEGCNQMFCTSCKIAFDWTTLRPIDTGRESFHNPHYAEFRKRQAKEGMEVLARSCDRSQGVPDFNRLLHEFTSILAEIEVKTYLQSQFAQTLRKANFVLRGGGVTNPYDELHEDALRLIQGRFLTGEINQDEFCEALVRREKQAESRYEFYQIEKMYANVAIDLAEKFIADAKDCKEKKRSKLFQELRAASANLKRYSESAASAVAEYYAVQECGIQFG